MEAFACGTRAEVNRVAYYNSATFTVYVFNHHNQIYRITPDAINLVDDGTDGPVPEQCESPTLSCGEARCRRFLVGSDRRLAD